MALTDRRQWQMGTLKRAIFVAGILLSAPSYASRLDIALKPTVQRGAVASIKVTERMTGFPSTPSWSIPSHIPHTHDIPGSIRDLALVDNQGPVPLEADSIIIAGTPVRRWTAARPTQGLLTLSYEMDAQPPSSSGGPPYGMIPAGGGIGGGMSGLLLVPEKGPWDVTVQADLASMASGSKALTSKGFMPLSGQWSSEELTHIWVLIGPGRQLYVHDFAGMQLGQSPPEGGDLMAYGAVAYETLARLFHHVGQQPYWFMLRAVDGPSFATGSAENNSTLVATGSSFANNQDAGYLHDAVFHELTHQWTGHNEPEEAWFSEGLTTYIADFLRCEEGLDPWSSCARQGSISASAAYGVAAHWSMTRISAQPFGDEAVRRTPYGRGMLYFAHLDAVSRRLRHKTLLQSMQPLLLARDHGRSISRAAWEAWLSREFGHGAVADFQQRVLAGDAPDLAPETAFSGCVSPVRYRTRPPGAPRFQDAWFWRATTRCKPGAPAR